MPVAFRQQRAGALLFRLGPGEYAFDAAVHFLKSVGTASEYTFHPFVIAADQEELPVLDDMGKVIVGSVAHIGKIYGGGGTFPGSIDHLAESGIFTPLSAGLDHEVGEPAIKDGIKSIDVNLVEAPCGFSVRLEESVWIIRIAENVSSRPVTGDELVFPVIKVLLQPAVKSVQQVRKSIVSKLPTLLVKSSFGWRIRGAAEITVKLFFGTVSFHGKEHHHCIMEPHFPVPGEVPARVDGILSRVSGDFSDCQQKQIFDDIRIFHKVPP